MSERAEGPQDPVVFEFTQKEYDLLIERIRQEGYRQGAIETTRTIEHYFGNSISPVLGYADLLANDPSLNDFTRGLASSIVKGVEGLNRVLMAMRSLEKFETVNRGGTDQLNINLPLSLSDETT